MRLLPSISTTSKLFMTGATVGPLVDSLHNQCLLEYDILPVALSLPSFAAGATVSSSHDAAAAIYSSWAIPPLLGVAYVVLGGILPRLFEFLLLQSGEGDQVALTMTSGGSSTTSRKTASNLRTRAIVAVATTAFIIKLSEKLETTAQQLPATSTAGLPNHINFLILLAAALSQWFALDGTIAALLAASVTSIGGPLSELPFVAHGFWHYLPEARDYFPLQSIPELPPVLDWLLTPADKSDGSSYQDLALSSLTGPCYFAVTMDAIALGRWFDTEQEDDTANE